MRIDHTPLLILQIKKKIINASAVVKCSFTGHCWTAAVEYPAFDAFILTDWGQMISHTQDFNRFTPVARINCCLVKNLRVQFIFEQVSGHAKRQSSLNKGLNQNKYIYIFVIIFLN